MDFKQLESFITIAKYGSFSKAAEKLYLTQPTLSNHIISLEKELDTLLFDRVNKRVSLTEAGMLFHQHALDILNSRDRAFFSLNKFKESITGILKISSSTVPQHYFLSNVISKFKQKYPEVTYKIMHHEIEDVINKLINGEIDFGIVGTKFAHKNIDYKEIMGDQVVLIAPKDFERDEIEISDLPKCPLIMRENGSTTRRTIIDLLKENNLSEQSLNIVAEIENTSTIVNFVRNNIGLAFISTREIADDLSCAKIKIVKIKDFEIIRNFYFAYNNKISFSPLCESFKNYIYECCENKKEENK